MFRMVKGSAVLGGVLALALWATMAHAEGPQKPSQDAFSGLAALSQSKLADLSGKNIVDSFQVKDSYNTTVSNENKQTLNQNGNSVNNVNIGNGTINNGTGRIEGNLLMNTSGFNTIMQNTGPNSGMMSNMNVNVYLK